MGTGTATEGEGRRLDLGGPRLGTGEVWVEALAVGPIVGAGLLTGTVAAFAGFNAPLSVLIASVGTLALAYVLGLYARRYAAAGGIYTYLREGLHPAIGLAGAGIYLLGLLFLGAGGVVVAGGYYLNELLDAELSLDLGWWVWSLVIVIVAAGLNHWGVRVGIRAIATTAAVSAIPFVVISVVIIAKGGADGNSLAVLDPGRTSWDAVFDGILFALTLFIGFEAVAALGEEAERPHRSIPLAMGTVIAVTACFFGLVTYAGTIGFGEEALAQNAWFASPNPFGELGQRYVGVDALGWIVNLAVVFDLFSVLLAFMLAGSRLLMAVARAGVLPAAVGRTSRRSQTPTGGIAVIAVWAVLVIAWSGISSYGDATGIPDALQALLILLAAGSYLITITYVLLAAGALWIQARDGEASGRWWRWPLTLVGLAVPALALYGSLSPLPEYPDDVSLYLAGGAIVASLLWLAVLRLWRPRALGLGPQRAAAERG